jgi:shikimate dehydrogenase
MPRLGVLGWPVAHSRSPRMQQAALDAAGLEGWTYQHLPVPPELFDETVRALPGAGFAGANVTIPHKEAALALADDATEAARAIGAANTLSFGDDAILASNTDAPGLLAALPAPPAGRRALVLGAGGSARAAVAALTEAGADVCVLNRTRERAEALVADLGGTVAASPAPADLLVNCTSVGMTGTLDELGLDAQRLGDYATVVDLAYAGGEETELVRLARAAGARVVDGLEVLVAQGALSFTAWTGREAPLAVMREAARNG